MLNGSSGCSKNALNSKWRISKNWEEKHKISNVSIFGNISDIQLKFSISIYPIFTYIYTKNQQILRGWVTKLLILSLFDME